MSFAGGGVSSASIDLARARIAANSVNNKSPEETKVAPRNTVIALAVASGGAVGITCLANSILNTPTIAPYYSAASDYMGTKLNPVIQPVFAAASNNMSYMGTRLAPVAESASAFLSSAGSYISSGISYVGKNLPTRESASAALSSAGTYVSNGVSYVGKNLPTRESASAALSSAGTYVSNGISYVGNNLPTRQSAFEAVSNGTSYVGTKMSEGARYVLTGSRNNAEMVMNAVKNNPRTTAMVALGSATVLVAVYKAYTRSMKLDAKKLDEKARIQNANFGLTAD